MKRFLNFCAVALIIGLFCSCGTWEDVYLIPKSPICVKLVSHFNEADGYIYINDRQAFEAQDRPACLKVYKTDVSATYITFRRDADTIMYIHSEFDNAQVVDPGKFVIEFVELDDSRLFHSDSKIKHAFIANPEYYEIYIDGFLNSVHLLGEDSNGESTSIRIPKLE